MYNVSNFVFNGDLSIFQKKKKLIEKIIFHIDTSIFVHENGVKNSFKMYVLDIC